MSIGFYAFDRYALLEPEGLQKGNTLDLKLSSYETTSHSVSLPFERGNKKQELSRDENGVASRISGTHPESIFQNPDSELERITYLIYG